MDVIKGPNDDCCSLTENQYSEMREAILNTLDLIDIMLDYCDYNSDNTKISPLLTMITKIRLEIKKLRKNFDLPSFRAMNS